MRQAGVNFIKAGVRGILFVSGMPYTDLFGMGRLDESGGLKRGYSRGIPGLESLLSVMRAEANGLLNPDEALLIPPLSNTKEMFRQLDKVSEDSGNFSESFVQLFKENVNPEQEKTLEVNKYVWSSLHHHIGRIEAALDLVEFLQSWSEQLSIDSDDRLLVQAHGHAGQVLALVSNLISPKETLGRQMIFEILANHYQRSQTDASSAVDRLDRLYRFLTDMPFMQGASLDLVTFGTPVRYGWELDRTGKLLHVVNHRPIRGDGKKWLGKMELPQIAWEIPMVLGGDYVQQLAVAGTDALPKSEQEQQACQELREIVEPFDGFERWLECARRGTRCSNDGRCLLVDYKDSGEGPCQEHLFGHGCYTRKNAMLFNTLEIVRQLYSE